LRVLLKLFICTVSSVRWISSRGIIFCVYMMKMVAPRRSHPS
jgi:hypothetical protein